MVRLIAIGQRSEMKGSRREHDLYAVFIAIKVYEEFVTSKLTDKS